MTLKTIFLILGQSLIVLFSVLVFFSSLSEIIIQSNSTISDSLTNSYTFIKFVLANINSSPIKNLYLSDTKNCLNGRILQLATWKSSPYCICPNKVFANICPLDSSSCQIKEEINEKLYFWKKKVFCKEDYLEWKFPINNLCETGYKMCETCKICVGQTEDCPITDINIDDKVDTLLPNYINLGEISTTERVSYTRSLKNDITNGLFINYNNEFPCLNREKNSKQTKNHNYVINRNNENGCDFLSNDNEILISVDEEDKYQVLVENGMTSLIETLPEFKISMNKEMNFLIEEKKIKFNNKPECKSLLSQEFKFDLNFDEFDDLRYSVALAGIIIPSILLVFFIIFYVLRKKNYKISGKKEFFYFWSNHVICFLFCIGILIGDAMSYDLLNNLKKNNEVIFVGCNLNCIKDAIITDKFAILRQFFEDYYQDREICIRFALIISASYIIMELFYVLWFGISYKFNVNLDSAEEIKNSEEDDD